jgi:aldehyde:ferredoxin oxidoreductase
MKGGMNMAHGFMGKMLNVDLATQKIEEEVLDEKLAKDYLGGYGLGAKILFDRQKPGVDPMGPDAILGIVTGMLTGTDAIGGSRYVMVGKSPLTGGWGDANSGGAVGPKLKFAGYDAVFFSGISDKPVYLLIDNGKAELRDASSIWGKDSFETQDILREELGKDTEIACLGPSGENLSLIAAVMNNKGRAAARSGLAAVMGSKKLKAIALKGNMKIPVADPDAAKAMRKKHMGDMGPMVPFMKEFGTCGMGDMAAESDDAPTKNWAGVATIDLPNYKAIGGKPIIEKLKRRYACYKCPIGCGGIMNAQDEGEYTWQEHAHKPEYETQAMFGYNLLNDDLDSVIKANDICNRYGLDTISAGAVLGFALECYENGIITKEDTGGLEMEWGNHKNIIAMLEMVGKREGIGDILADGVKIAAEKIGKGAEKYAMHIGGQEIAAHDSRGGPHFAIGYCAEPTPGRHTMAGEGPHPKGLMPDFDRGSYKGRGEPHKLGACFSHVFNAVGLCMIAYGDGYGKIDYFIEALSTISGWDYDRDKIVKAGERVNTMRQAFNIREGITGPWQYPDRMLGKPPKEVGPRAGISMELSELYEEYWKAMDWDVETGKPSKAKLLELGMDSVATALYP